MSTDRPASPSAPQRQPQPQPQPQPAYLPTTPSSPLLIDPTLYSRLASAPRTLTYTHTLPPRTGHAWRVSAGQILRLSTPRGPQVADLNLWSAHNPRERFWAARTRQLHASHVSVGDRLWSCLPYLRPMVTIVADSLQPRGRGDGDGGMDVDGVLRSAHGGRVHDLLGTRCDPYVNALLSGGSGGADDEANPHALDAAQGAQFDAHCHSNLVRAILPFHLTEPDVHDVLNLFQVTGLDARGRYFMETSPARAGDHVDFFAEIDLLCAVSACPGGDLSRWGFGLGSKSESESEKEEGGMEECCREVKVEVFELVERERVLEGWRPPRGPGYRGCHGLRWKERDGEKKEEER